MNAQPLVSILIPTHRVNLLKHSLQSALSQTYSNTEIIVSDNSENDEIRQLCAQYPQVRYYRNPRPTKTDFWMNVENPMQHARGEYIKYLFDDDLLFPNCLDTMIGQLNRLPKEMAQNIQLVFSSRHIFDDDGVAYGRLTPSGETQPTVFQGQALAAHILTHCSNVIGELSTCLFKNIYHPQWQDKELFRYGDTTTEFGLVDVGLYMHLLEQGDALYLPFDLSAFRLHQSSASNPNINPLFVHAVTDWFNLIIEANKRQRLNREQTIQALSHYIGIANMHIERYPEQLTAVNEQATALIEKLQQSE